MNETYIFRRNARGTAELAAAGSTLSPKHRRCLTLVDGRNTVRDLAAYFRPGELGPLLRELVERGLLDAPEGGTGAIESATGKIAFIDDKRFLEVQRRAMAEISARLGPRGEGLVMQIGACVRPEQLRISLRSVEKTLAALQGAEYANDFVKRVGRELMGS